jgi:alcohol dehydrogenase class IV
LGLIFRGDLLVGKSIYEFNAPKRVYAGEGSISRISNILTELDCEKVVLITDGNLVDTGICAEIRDIVTGTGAQLIILSGIPREPTDITVLSLYQHHIFNDADLVIGFGGGSVLDCAKLLSVIPNNPGLMDDIMDSSMIKNSGIPQLMIPTTAGTGSEATPNSILTNSKTNIKTGVISTKLIADYVILDPQATLSLPPHLTAATGFDALAHSLECYISRKATPFSDLYAVKSIQLVFENLVQAYREPEDIEARHNMLLASYYGGVCISCSSTTAVHAMAYPLSSMFKLPHGLSIAVLLPRVLEYISGACEDLFAYLAYMLKFKNHLSKSEASREFVNALLDLADNCGIELSISRYGVTKEHLDIMADEAIKIKRLFDNTPVALNKSDLVAIYSRLI